MIKTDNNRLSFPFRKLCTCLPAFLLAAALSGCRAVSQDAARSVTFRMMTYNIHHGEGLDGKIDLRRIADLIKREKADIVSLQEVDKGVPRTDHRDLCAELAALTGMTGIFGKNYDLEGGEYGNAVLTRFPVKTWRNLHYVMMKPGEQRGLLQLRLDVKGRDLVLMNTHFDDSPEDDERMQSVNELPRAAASYAPAPMILSGDFNDLPHSRVYNKLSETLDDTWTMAGSGAGITYPGDNQRIDYVWRSRDGALTPLKAWIPVSAASDHLPLVVEFRLRQSAE